jgi:hypothetical protein
VRDWTYSGDASLTYGGTFVRDQGHWFDVVEVMELPANGLTLIESGNVSADKEREAITNALAAWGDGWREPYRLGATTREQSRARIAQALWESGGKDIDTSVVLVTDSPYIDDCAHCGESILYRNDRWQHEGAAADGSFVACMDGGGELSGTEQKPTGTSAAPKTPVKYENGAESWPDLLADDWAKYADGEAGIRRYLSEQFEIEHGES